MNFYDYKVENGMVSAKGTYQEDDKEQIPIVIAVEPSGKHYIFSETTFSEEKQEWIAKAFKSTLEAKEE
jgi:hypothetical protein